MRSRPVLALGLMLTLASVANAQDERPATANLVSTSAVLPDLTREHVADMVGVFFRPGITAGTNTYYHLGPERGTGTFLVLQPVLPFKLTKNWKLVSRWVTPVVSLPRFTPTQGPQLGLGNIQPEFYLAPAHQGKVLWGIGPKAYLPTATDKSLGVNKWGGGPAAAVLTLKGRLAVGALVNNVWAGSGARSVNQLNFNPVAYFYVNRGFYLVSAPQISANWHAASDRWTVPVGFGIGRFFQLGQQHLNARVQCFNNAVRPAFTSSWQFQAQVQFLFPQGYSKKMLTASTLWGSRQ